MKITRQNYEHWFIDFSEGSLSTKDEAMVSKFVQSNPDLKYELDEILEFKLVPQKTIFTNKHLIKKDKLTAIEDITTIEQLSVSFLEKEINDTEKLKLETLIKNSKKNKSEFNIIQNTKINADTDIKYKFKSDLKKSVFVKKSFINFNYLYRIAAIFILLVTLTFYFNKEKNILFGKSFIKTNGEFYVNKTSVKNIYDKKTDIKLIENQEILAKDIVINHQILKPYKCNSITENSNNLVFTDINNIKSVKIADVNKIPIKEKYTEKLISTVKESGKSVYKKLSKTFNKQIKYKKIYTDDGRMLIALKAGDFEYKISKKQKKVHR